MSIQEWNEKDFKEKIYVEGRLSGVEFYSDSCPACRSLGTVLDRVSEGYSDRMTFGKINVNREEALAEKYAIRSVPTFMIFCEGKGVCESVGSMGAGALKSMINEALTRVSTEG